MTKNNSVAEDDTDVRPRRILGVMTMTMAKKNRFMIQLPTCTEFATKGGGER